MYAHKLLETFVVRAKRLYGEWFLVYNVHSLTHIAAAADRYGSLDVCSAWRFENHLGKMKNMVRSGSKPLEQLVKRLQERKGFGSQVAPVRFSVQVKRPNNAFVLSDVVCCEVISGPTIADRFECLVYKVSPLYMWPCNSALLGHFVAHGAGARRSIPADKLRHKAMLLVDGSSLVFMSLLHDQ